jgi:DNA-binding NtrC family response regulator
VLARWEREPWPGNVRELRNAVARFLALGETEGAESAFDSPMTALADQWVALLLAQGASFSAARQRLMSTFERQYVEQMLAAHDGNVSRAAAASGIARRYFQILRARREKAR